MKRLLIISFVVLAACGNDSGPKDTPQECIARGGEWVLTGSTYRPGAAIPVGNPPVYFQTPGHTTYKYGCTVPVPEETIQP